MLGFAKDNPDILISGADYLKVKEKFWETNPTYQHAIKIIS
jgi:hypothetical protein